MRAKRAILLLFVVAVALSGCGDDDGGTDNAAAPNSSSSALPDAASDAVEPSGGGETEESRPDPVAGCADDVTFERLADLCGAEPYQSGPAEEYEFHGGPLALDEFHIPYSSAVTGADGVDYWMGVICTYTRPLECVGLFVGEPVDALEPPSSVRITDVVDYAGSDWRSNCETVDGDPVVAIYAEESLPYEIRDGRFGQSPGPLAEDNPCG